MSSRREPLWFCHECNAEMRPLMMPDPVCASCRGSFIEKMENPDDDPREFHQAGPGHDGPMHPEVEPFLMALQSLLAPRGMGERPTSPLDRERHSSGVTFQMGPNSGSISFDGVNTLGGTRNGGLFSPDNLRGPNETNGGRGIAGSLMAQYLVALLGRDPLTGLHGDLDPAEHGRMGDYVFNQEALDRIMTQLMENSNTSRPVPATEDIIGALPREVLEAGSHLLEKDCAVCKEQFQTETDDPDEQIVVTLPCKHPFHEPCILPWLKSSGTCPVCRHALVEQPEQHPPPSSPPRHSPDRSQPSPGSSPTGGGGGLFQSLFGSLGSHPPHEGSSGRQHSSRHRPERTTSNRRSSVGRANQNSDPHIPGRWEGDD